MDRVEENISNFDESCKFFERELSHNELYECLKTGSIGEKQLACIRLEACTRAEEAEILMQNLTGIDGKVREAVSFKLRTFMPESKELFLRKDFYDIFLDAIIDINGNICRNIITALQTIAQVEDFYTYTVPEIIKRGLDVVNTIENFDYKDRKYVTNKEVFKLYWYLETLSIFPVMNAPELFGLLERCAKVEEYTIREKTARLLLKLPVEYKLDGLNFDNNFYVNLALSK
ncbi:MAG: hypothetical protein NC390_01770 [Fusobacterium sp.]|nr:hypothetical protein [Fusobacterium sp.]